MRLLLTKSYNTVLIIIIVPLTLSSLCLLLLVCLVNYNPNLYDFCFYRIVGKLFSYNFRSSSRSNTLPLVLEVLLTTQVEGWSRPRKGCITTDYVEYRRWGSHTHPSHNQKSLLLTSSLSLDVPVPNATQCM